MTREEIKKMLPILQAFAEGKTIECRIKPSSLKGSDTPNEWSKMENLEYWNNTEYRIKPESKYRPFKDAEECWNEMQKHQPFGWLKNIEFEKYFLIDEITSLFSDAQIHISAYERKKWSDFSTVFHNNTFADGTPFGVKEEK